MHHAPGESVRRLVFIDTGVEEPAELARSATPDARVALGSDGGDPVLSALAAAGAVAELHVVSHGRPGAVRLGGFDLGAGALARRGRGWRRFLGSGATIVLYGCESGRGAAGRRLVAALARATGARVAAASAPVGAAARGGGWRFDVVSDGGAPRRGAFPAAEACWPGLLTAYRAGQANPFGLTDLGSRLRPHFVDFDGDGDFDAFVGENGGATYFLENTGNAASAAFAAGVVDPFGLVAGNQRSSPDIVDIDGDTDVDALVGKNFGGIAVFANAAGAFTSASDLATSDATPIDVGFNASPALVDIDGDGDRELFVGNSNGNIHFFASSGSDVTTSLQDGGTLPFGLTNVGPDAANQQAALRFVDIDGDGDLDLFSGHTSGNLYFFENTGDAGNPAFAAVDVNPFGLGDSGSYSAPDFVDIDEDGDLDALVANDGGFLFFENVGATVSRTDDVGTGTLRHAAVAAADDGELIRLDDLSGTIALGTSLALGDGTGTNETLTLTLVGATSALSVSGVAIAPSADLGVVHVDTEVAGGTLTIESDITGGTTAIQVFDNEGDGVTLVLGGTNTFSGGVAVLRAGTVSIAADSALGSGGVTLDGGVLAVTGATTIDNAVALGADGGTIAVDPAVTLSGAISGASSLTKTGAGTLTLSAVNSGATATLSVTAGTVSVAGDSSLTAGDVTLDGGGLRLTGATTVDNGLMLGAGGGTLDVGTASTLSGAISGTSSLTKTGTGTLTLSAVNSGASATLSVTAGAVSVAADDNLVGGAVTLDGGTLAVTGSGTIDNAITIGAGDGTVDTAATVVLSGVIGGSGSFGKAGAGTVALEGTNAYAGDTSIAAGTVRVAGGSAIGDGSTVSVAGGATFDLDETAETIGGLTGAGSVDLGATGTGALTVDVAVASAFSGTFGGTGTIAKAGAGTLTLAGANSASAATLTVEAGTVSVAGDDNLVGGAVTLSGGGLAVTGATAIDNALDLALDATLTTSDTVTLLGAVTASGAGSGLTKEGAGRLILANAGNSYDGSTTVAAGRLQVDGSLTDTSGVTVRSGATLGGTGTIAAGVTGDAGATLAPGASPGILSVGSLALATGSSLEIEIDGPSAGSQHDRVAATGAVALDTGGTGGATLDVQLGYTPSVGDGFTIVTSGVGISGTFDGLAEGASFQETVGDATVTFSITYAGGAGTDVVLTVLAVAAPGSGDGGDASGATSALDAYHDLPVGLRAVVDAALSRLGLSPESLEAAYSEDSAEHSRHLGDRHIATGRGGVELVGSDDNGLEVAGSVRDVVSGAAGEDTLAGREDADLVLGNQGADVLLGNAGGDQIYGGQDGDSLYGGQDADIVLGNLGDDAVFGNLGDDVVHGGQGDDLVHGGQGDDTVVGGVGDDTVMGGLGDDTLSGGEGADTFVFQVDGGGDDTILDFTPGEDAIQFAAGLNGLGLSGGADLLARLSTDAAGNAVLDLGDGQTLTLSGIAVSGLDTASFIVA